MTCQIVDAICPPAKTIVNRLAEKHREAVSMLDEKKRLRIDPRRILTRTKKIWRATQTVDLTTPPPPPDVTRKILVEHTFPGLLACLHARYYCSRGFLMNDVLSLTGPGGMGKSTIMFYIVEALGGVLISSDEEAVDTVLTLIRERRWTPIVVLDDVAGIINKYWYLDKETRHWKDFFGALEYMKDFTGVLAATARTFEGEAKRIRELSTFKGDMYRVVYGEYIADIILWYKGRSLQYVDYILPGLRLPEEVWQRYMENRRKMSMKLLEKIETQGTSVE